MRFKRVLFIVPLLAPYFRSSFSLHVPHPGIGYLSAILKKHGIESAVYDMKLGYDMTHLVQYVRTFEPELVAATCYTYGHLTLFEILDQLKREVGLPVVIGGPHVSLFGKESLMKASHINFAIRYEGEYPLLELYMGDQYSEITNLLYRENNEIHENRPRKFMTSHELDELPHPTYEQFDLDKYSKLIPIISSRGCPHECIYCSVNQMAGRKFRPRSAQNVVSEMMYFYKSGFRRFSFWDDSFMQSPRRVKEICRLLKDDGMRDWTLDCLQGVRADCINREVLSVMKEVGFHLIGLGVETLNDNTLRFIKKGQNRQQIEEAVKNLCDLGFRVSAGFMIGLPGDDWKATLRSFWFALKYPIWSATFYVTLPYPGTELYNWLAENGLLIRDPDIYYLENKDKWEDKPCYRNPSMPYKQIIFLKKLAKIVSTLVLARTTLRLYISRRRVLRELLHRTAKLIRMLRLGS